MFSFSPSFIGQVVSLAREIAFHQRGEPTLQDVDTLVQRFIDEQVELEESAYPPEEITDVLYYACCLWVQGRRDELEQLSQDLPAYGYSQKQVEAATIAKYRLRAVGPKSKDKAAELAAIQTVLEENS